MPLSVHAASGTHAVSDGGATAHPAVRHAAQFANGATDALAAGSPEPDTSAPAQNGTVRSDRRAHRPAEVQGDSQVDSQAPSQAPSQADSQADAQGDPQADAHEPLGPDDPLAPLPFNPYKGNRGITRAWHAMKNSLAGFQVAIREESAFRQELTLAAILVPCGIFVPVEPVARVLLLGSVLLVLIVELLNSSVEAAIDRISLERHELSRRAKDLGSAAVMVALGMCVMTWALIVGPLLIRWIGRLL